MPVPTLVTDLSTTLASNSPSGSDNVFPDLDNYLRAISAFIASIRDNSGNGWVSPYLPLAGGTVTGATIFSSTVALNGALSGTGLTTYLASPPAIGGTTPAAGSFTTLSASGNVTLSGGTANGVLYLNGSKVATSGSALTFDGTTLGSTGGAKVTGPAASLAIDGGTFDYSATVTRLAAGRAGGNYGELQLYVAGASGVTKRFSVGYDSTFNWYDPAGTGQYMTLTSTGLGIGTSSPGAKLEVSGTSTNIYLRSTDTGDATLRYFVNGTEVATARGKSGGNYVIETLGNERMRLDSSGNLGLGVTPGTWNSTSKAIQISDFVSISQQANGAANFGFNFRESGVNSFIYPVSDEACRFSALTDGGFGWFTAPSGTAGNAISFTQALTLDANRNLLLNGTTVGASSVGTFTIFNGTAPTGSVTDGVILFAQDISSSSELRVRDEAGNVTTLSPHNFSLIPEGPSEEMAWAYYSEKGGKRINVDMLKLARMVEKLTGEKLVYES